MQSSVFSDDLQLNSSRPEIRNDTLCRTYDNEAVAWSQISHQPIYLDPVAALLFQLLDGTASVAGLITDVHQIVGIPEAIARNRIHDVLSQLDEFGLLTTSAMPETPDVGFDLFPAPPNP